MKSESDSILSLCNAALKLLACPSASSMNPNGSREERCCCMFYETVRKEVLCEVPWPFAVRRAVLESSEPEEWGCHPVPARAHALPDDCLKVLRVRADWWVCRGRLVFARRSPLLCSYVCDCTDLLQCDARFKRALTLKLAYAMSRPLGAEREVREMLLMNFRHATEHLRVSHGVKSVNNFFDGLF
ncbi:hypothetical protein ICN84_02115 [Akkermansia glycaniphila]|uniref:hypothetical protein n=1 Tax=Akkermansia glycaniphila TaxID=1679444 RepID=UPI001C01DEF4|nr:hypothetical protein [Akkermansia glycaniphila]MBT9448864.1 hypothetical protein [Akkermansia glycaniphila]